MPWCPTCRSEYRAGYTECKACAVALVDALPGSDEIGAEELEGTIPVGTFIATELGVPAFVLARASELGQILLEAGIPAVLGPYEDIPSPDLQPRFQVRVRPKDTERAESTLKAAYQADTIDTGTPDTCEACGAHFPLDAEECPGCGLYVGKGAPSA